MERGPEPVEVPEMKSAASLILERSVGRENRVQVIGLIGVMKKFAFTWLVNQTFII